METYCDYHVHPGYSVDAEPVAMADYCRRALEMGLSEICFTPHFEVDPARRHIDWFVRLEGKILPMDDPVWVDRYFEELEHLRSEFLPCGLTIRAGLEVGYERGQEKAIEKITLHYPFDFVLGSIHSLDHVAISSCKECAGYFPRHNLREMASAYFNSLREAVESGLFDVMGHLDLYRRYGAKYYGPEITTAHVGLVESVLRIMAEREIGLEINTSGLYRGDHEYHPGESLLALAVRAGVSVFTVGSDAHRLSELGRGVQDAVCYLQGKGLKVSTFSSRKIVKDMEKAGRTKFGPR